MTVWWGCWGIYCHASLFASPDSHGLAFSGSGPYSCQLRYTHSRGLGHVSVPYIYSTVAGNRIQLSPGQKCLFTRIQASASAKLAPAVPCSNAHFRAVRAGVELGPMVHLSAFS